MVNQKQDHFEILQQKYRSESSVRAANLTDETSRHFYADYIDFIGDCKPEAKLLDVGCGCGWSSFHFAEKGFETTGIDLNPNAFEPPPHERLTLLQGSAMSLEFDDSSFDITCSYQVLEHVPDPEKMLLEMVRVTKPGGLIAIVGPNLLGLAGPLRGIFVYSLRNRPLRNIFFRSPGMPRHPGGNTLPESIYALGKRFYLNAQKLVSKKTSFTFRTPDLIPPFHADNDAVYLCNPIDLERFFVAHNCTVIRRSALGRGSLSRIIATGTWVMARKS